MRTHTANRNSYGAGVTPAAINASVDQFNRRPAFSCPLANGAGDSLQSKDSITPAVGRLALASRPHHITHFVMSVIVDAIKRVFVRRATSNARQKLTKTCKTKLNPALSIAIITIVIGIITPIFGSSVGPIFWRLDSGNAFAVGDGSHSDHFSPHTPTRLSMSIFKIASVNNGFSSTLTDAIPQRQSLGATCETMDGNASESLPCQVLEFRAGGVLSNNEFSCFHSPIIANINDTGKQTQAILALHERVKALEAKQ